MDTDTNTLYWLAGLLEGEAWFGSTKQNGNIQPYPNISVNMTDEDVVARVANVFGTGHLPLKPKNANWQTTYLTRIRGTRAHNLMKAIYPMMGKRRQQQIDKIFEKYVYMPNQKGENQNGAKLTDEKVREIKRRIMARELARDIALP
jgi:hypothetical protein